MVEIFAKIFITIVYVCSIDFWSNSGGRRGGKDGWKENWRNRWSIVSLPKEIFTRKHSNRVRTARFCGSEREVYRTPPQVPLPPIPKKGHGNSDQEGTWDQRYPTTPLPHEQNDWQTPAKTLPSSNCLRVVKMKSVNASRFSLIQTDQYWKLMESICFLVELTSLINQSTMVASVVITLYVKLL